MKRRLRILLAVLALGVAALLWLRSRDNVLSERPLPEGEGIQFPAPQESVAVAKVMIGFAAMSEALNGIKELQSFSQSARENLKMTQKIIWGRPAPIFPRAPLRRVRDEEEIVLFSQDVDYTINASRTGDFVFSPNGNGLRVSAPIGFSGQVGFTGDIAKVLSLDKKNFDGQMEVHLDVTFDVDESWKPVLEVKPGFDWKNKAQIEIVGGIWIPIAKYLTDPLNKALEKAAGEISGRISADDLKREVAKIWKAQAIPLEQKGKVWGYCNVRPTGAFFSGTTVLPEILEFNIGLAAIAQFADKPNPAVPEDLPLPPLHRPGSQPNRVRMFVPVEARFDTIKGVAIETLKGNTFQGQTPVGNAKVSINDVEIFSQKDRIVLGLKFEARFDNARLNERGWIYLTAKPVFNSNRQEVSLDDIRFTRIINNDIWKTLSILFEGIIKDSIKKNARHSLNGDIAELKSSLQASLSKSETTPGLRISLQPDKARLNSIAVSDDGISVITELEGTIAVEIYSAALLKK